MKKLHILLLLLLPFTFFSCKEDIIDGFETDIIKLDSKKAEFTAEGGSKTINSEGSWWWISHFVSKNDSILLFENNPDIKVEMGRLNDWNNPNVIYDDWNNMEIRKIESGWFTITKTSNKSLEIETKPNETDSARSLELRVQAGNYHDYITITQSAK